MLLAVAACIVLVTVGLSVVIVTSVIVDVELFLLMLLAASNVIGVAVFMCCSYCSFCCGFTRSRTVR